MRVAAQRARDEIHGRAKTEASLSRHVGGPVIAAQAPSPRFLTPSTRVELYVPGKACRKSAALSGKSAKTPTAAGAPAAVQIDGQLLDATVHR